MPLDPTTRPALRLLPLLRLLADHEVDWILTGSTVLAVHGGQLVPNDVDVTPELSAENLRRLSAALAAAEAVPAYLPGWSDGLSLAQCAAWTPEPATEQNLDHLFVTRLGLLDVPPRLCGTYHQLLPGASRVDIGGVPVLVCAVKEVLDRLPERQRPKDVQRAAIYADLARRMPAAPAPAAIAWLLEQLAKPPADPGQR